MTCKNCSTEIAPNTSFCYDCGAKFVHERITTKKLFSDLLTGLGWDSVFFFTIKSMFSKPHIVLTEYLDGTRKKYLNPFSYLLISAAILISVINFFKDDFDAIQKSFSFNKEQIELANKDLSQIKDISESELSKLKKDQEVAKFSMKWANSFLKYFNIITLLFLPFFSFMSKWTYKKPYNYGEHIIINTYLYGTSMIISTVCFFLAKFIHPKIYFFNILVFMILYSYTLTKVYNHTLKQAISKLLRFILVFIFTSFILIIIIVILAILIAYIYK